MRIRADQDQEDRRGGRTLEKISPLRVAMLKACLTRTHRWKLIAEDVLVSLDLETINSAYRLGRLFSVWNVCKARHWGSATPCEDYRAAAGIDLDMDRADDEAGNKIRAPLLALWGAKGTVGQMWDVLATWRPKAAGPVVGEALPCGHLIPEEQPELVISHFRQFFKA